MTVLITRGWPGAEQTATGLRAMGIDPIICPVMDVNFRAKIDADLSDVQALAFTSANGVRSWGPRRPERDLPVFTVGNATAELARNIGFKKVHSARGDVEDLGKLIKRKLRPSGGSILHIRGIHTAGNLAGDLRKDGYTAREAIGYGTVPVDVLSEEAIAAIISGAPVQVLIHSGRGAKTFLDLARKFGLHHWLGSVTALGISEKALKPLENAGFADLIAAREPNEQALLGLLGEPMQLVSAGNAS
ncbi:uroporphyrinogen-III synthase [Maricaulis sp.]|uniref:uroporphyrinogen-III synthase n=1 Tax=Maricaulis sp. TaxID=1486257 RepID=UPI00261E3866|nr:uroporphyrinogen-III synthase [Maricaulis sp.]